MVIIGIGLDDPRAWVRAAYLLLSEMESGQTGPPGKLSSRSQVAAKLGVHRTTVARAYRELTDLGIIYLVPGLGYVPSVKSER
jgi:DNA-binding transcriptional regulator YhcF (GntR family)